MQDNDTLISMAVMEPSHDGRRGSIATGIVKLLFCGKHQSGRMNFRVLWPLRTTRKYWEGSFGAAVSGTLTLET